ncbi:acyl-CoA dehydrogenase family protein [Undibacterium sp. RuRC25W]|uniref:acyl-CoA dehydrogenase family protein n=1 Tax=Undibacterium sp. RuRC25W TaxID=3413047 RepID=UPI003BF06946
MNFEHSEERRMLADSLNRFISEQYTFDERNTINASEQGISRKIWRQLADLGTMAALFSEEDGGLGGTGFDLAVIFEALGRGLVLEPVLSSAVLAGSVIAEVGNTSQQQWLERIIDGSNIAALAHEEAASNNDLPWVESSASTDQDGWRLHGAKALVSYGGIADVFVVSARTSGDIAEESGISLFLVPAGTPGLSIDTYPLIDGGRAAELRLDNVWVSKDALLGILNHAYPVIEKVTARGILALCAEALGAMEVCKAATLDYLQTRQQFGLAIGQFQALQHRMADVLLEIEQARSSVINAAAAIDADRLTRERAVSAAKFSIGRIGTLVAEESIQLHGGIGMTWELPLSHYAKRLIMIDHQLGDEDFHLQRYISLSKEVKEASHVE